MKKDIHPQFFPKAKITCSCKNVVYAGSTIEEQQTEICSACHPFYTGKQKLVDTAGRVTKFKERMKKAEAANQAKKAKKAQEKPENEKVEKE